MMKRKVIVVGHLPNRGKFETGQVLSPKGICRALKSTDYKNPPFVEVDDGRTFEVQRIDGVIQLGDIAHRP